MTHAVFLATLVGLVVQFTIRPKVDLMPFLAMAAVTAASFGDRG